MNMKIQIMNRLAGTLMCKQTVQTIDLLRCCVPIIAFFCVFSARTSSSATLTTLYSFPLVNEDGGHAPSAGLVQGNDGNFYGTAEVGGVSNAGTVFKISPSRDFTTLYTFSGVDGFGPRAKLIQASDGNFYSTTVTGGTNGGGTVFKITPQGVLTTLHSFLFLAVDDGTGPQGELVQGSDGNLYGTTSAGGPGPGGTVFKITLTGTLTVLHYFTGADDGATPIGGLCRGSDNNFYGTTTSGGSGGMGTIFKVTPSGTFTVLHGFKFDGSEGYYASALVEGADGNFYGTNYFGGAESDGTIFKITLFGIFTDLYDLSGPAKFGGSGTNPHAALFKDEDDSFYGTTLDSVFNITSSGALTVVYAFDFSQGEPYQSGVIRAKDNGLYGTTWNGGDFGSGTIFNLTASVANLGNISTRLSVGTGDNVLIGGFIVTGTQAKKVIVRGIGPSLPITGVLADPLLELHDSTGATIASNDNWVDSPNKQAIIDSTIPPTNDKEPAILMTLDPGAYTAIVRGVSDTTGIALIEVYDLASAVDSKLANISTRGFVQTGDDVMIGGLIIFSDSARNVIIRAIGPSLPLGGALVDPSLELHNGDGDLINSNDNWRSDQEADILATGLQPTQDKESAIVAALDPGLYTAIVRGVNNTTGVALVEVYDLQ
jgi:uncharacterized repeat protein (TIGR03803 family)